MAVVEPMIRTAGIDVIWFGIFIVVVVEMAQITPPIGFNLFVLQGMTGHEMSYLSKVALPMFAMMVVTGFYSDSLPGTCYLSSGQYAVPAKRIEIWLPLRHKATAGIYDYQRVQVWQIDQ